MTCEQISGNDIDGLLAYLCLAISGRFGKDVAGSTSVRLAADSAQMAAAALRGFNEIRDELAGWGHDIFPLMEPYNGCLRDLDGRLRTVNPWERILKTYVIVGVITDTMRLLQQAVRDTPAGYTVAVSGFGCDTWATGLIAPTVESDRKLASRLSLWGRRVFGEVLGTCNQLVESELRALAPTSTVTTEQIHQQLTELQQERMRVVGL